MNNIGDKNPKDDVGRTPFHDAAWEGHFNICKYIMSLTEDINPKMSNGFTPLHLAAYKGHHDICELIVKNVKEKIPR